MPEKPKTGTKPVPAKPPSAVGKLKRRRTDVAPPPLVRPAPVTVSHFITTSEYVDKSVPYLKFTRHDLYFASTDPEGHFGDNGVWSDLAPDHVAMCPVSESPERGLRDITREEAEKTLVEGPVTVGDGPIRARLGAIGIRRHEWERTDPGTRKVIKDFLRAEAELVEVVVAATLVPADHDTQQIQKKAKRFLADVTADLARRGKATNSPLTAVRRDRAWREAQALLNRLTGVLEEIEAEAEGHDIVNEHTWVAAQTSKVNGILTKFRNGLYYACVTDEMLRSLKTKHAKGLAREITHLLHPDVSVDDLRRRQPPRQRSNDTKPSKKNEKK